MLRSINHHKVSRISYLCRLFLLAEVVPEFPLHLFHDILPILPVQRISSLVQITLGEIPLNAITRELRIINIIIADDQKLQGNLRSYKMYKFLF